MQGFYETNLLAQRIESVIELSIRTSNCLMDANIVTLGQLVEKSTGDLKRIKGFGKKSLQELRTKLSRIGLSLNEEH